MKKNKGITLIALVITIIVLLILAGVSITALIGENGILEKTTYSKLKTEVAKEQEQVNLAYTSCKLDIAESNDDFVSAKQLETKMNSSYGEGTVIVTGESILTITYVDSNRTYTINQDAKIRDKEFLVTNSNDEIIFNNTITSEEIVSEYGENYNLEIIGVSSNENDGYILSGSISGKTGELQIVGDISNFTFEYSLNDIMLGDEIFFVKIKINDEERIQRLAVVQGESVFYEEEFLEFKTYTWDYSKNNWTESIGNVERWIEIEGNTWSSGKARKLNVDYDTKVEMLFDFYGSKFDLVWGQTERNSGVILTELFDESGANTKNSFLVLDSEELGVYDFTVERDYKLGSVKQTLSFDPVFDSWKLGESTLVVDGIRVWK